jgi:hypothetical protein
MRRLAVSGAVAAVITTAVLRSALGGTFQSAPVSDVKASSIDNINFTLTDGESEIVTKYTPTSNVVALLTYNLASIPSDAYITSATVTFRFSSFQTSALGVRVFARLEDDGIPSASDVHLGTFAGTSPDIYTTEATPATLDPAVFRELFSLGSYIGLNVFGPTNGNNAGFRTLEFDPDRTPILTLTYEVPEPSSLAMLLPAVVLLRRGRQARGHMPG